MYSWLYFASNESCDRGVPGRKFDVAKLMELEDVLKVYRLLTMVPAPL